MNKLLEKFRLHQDSLFLVVVIVLVGLIGFGLGRLSAKYQTAELKIESTLVNTADLNKIVTGSREKTTADVKSSPQPADGEVVSLSSSVADTERKIVGNKNSKIYHYNDCPGALRMKEENRVVFASILDAKNAGCRPAGNCQGLD